MRTCEEHAYPPVASIEMYVCPDSQALATQYCPEAELKLFVPGTEPKEICNVHGPNSGYPIEPGQPGNGENNYEWPNSNDDTNGPTNNKD